MQEELNKPQKSGTSKILIAIAVLEAVIIVAMAVMMASNKKEAEILLSKVESGVREKDSLRNEMSLIMDSYDQLQTSNDTISAQLEEQKAKVAELMESLNRTNARNRDSLKKYHAEVETLRAIMRSFVVQIDSLNTKNIALTEENTRLSDQLSTAKSQNRKLSSDKDSLQGRVKLAEALKAVDMKLYALNERDNETSRIVKTSKFMVTFSLAENSMAGPGNKDLMVRVVKPDGGILINENSGLFKFEGKEISYSAKKTVAYSGSALPATVYVISREVLKPGLYQADVFCEGNRIGSVSATIN